MNDEYFRITCENIGIYQYFKKYLWSSATNPSEVWNDFIKSDENDWLDNPVIYADERKKHRSYFTASGYEKFLENTLPLITKWIDREIIKIEKVKIDEKSIVYQDEYQVVIEIDKME